MLFGCVFEVVVCLLDERVIASCYLSRWCDNSFRWAGEGRHSHGVWFSIKRAGKKQTGCVTFFQTK